MSNLEHGAPVTPASIFHVGSVSKQFTAAAVQPLVQDGKLSWSDDIRRYAPRLPAYGHTITLASGKLNRGTATDYGLGVISGRSRGVLDDR